MTNPDTNLNFPNTLRKYERLYLKQAFDRLYKGGKPIFVKGIRFIFLTQIQPLHVELPCIRAQIAFVVPKKYIRKAHDRNRIKRLLREHYRNKKNNFYHILAEKQLYCHLCIVYLSKNEYKSSYLAKIYDSAFEEIFTQFSSDSAENFTDH